MKQFTSVLFSIVFFTFSITGTYSQTVDEILDNYFENTGGVEKWQTLTGVKVLATVNQGGMEIPLEIVQLSDGRMYTKVNFQGMEIMQNVFDGENLWSTNFQTMEPEKADAELAAIQKLEANDFPDPFLNYKKKGYKVELIGEETMEGAETFKVKLTKEPIIVNGEETESISYYFFDAEYFLPVAQESEVKLGPQKGATSQVKFSDYQEVEGLYFAFSLSQGIKDVGSQPIMIQTIELNPEISDSAFSFPEKK